MLPLALLQAEEIAEKVCRSVASSLVGRKHASFTRVSAVVRVRAQDAVCSGDGNLPEQA